MKSHDLSHSGPPGNRRGVLLLVVLSLLTLFLMLGAAYVVSATRARNVARAFARLTLDSDAGRIDHERFLDETLVRVLRGGGNPTKSPSLAALLPNATDYRFESLLADRYGSTETIRGTLSGSAAITGTSAKLITATCQLSGTLPHPALLNGRIFTFTAPGRAATSHRILRATVAGASPANPYTFVLTPSATLTDFVSPPAGSPVIINGREFSGDTAENESFDSFDMASNPFLAHLSAHDIPSESICNKMSFVRPLDLSNANDATVTFESDPDLLPYAADNDNDGEPDGVFLDFGFPSIPTPSGQSIRLDASVLIVDLDSRFNVNAHGSLAPPMYQATGTTHTGWPTVPISGTTTFGLGSSASADFVPMGSGYGPPEVSADKLRFAHTYNPPADESPWMFTLLGGNTSVQFGARTFGSRFTEGAFTARLPNLPGRYGDVIPSGTTAASAWGLSGTTMVTGTFFGKPGVAFMDDPVSQITDRGYAPPASGTFTPRNYGVPATWWSGTTPHTFPSHREIYNSPPDLHGRLKIYTVSATGGAVVPTLTLAKPEWGGVEATDDPYEIQLDAPARGAGWAAAVSPLRPDAPYTYAELEKVLRPYDIDSHALAPRLAAALGSAAEESRLLFTTDSWDTTAITGTAAQRIRNWINASGPALPASSSDLYSTTSGSLAPASGILSGELARGEKFDINRPLSGTHPGSYVPSHEYFLQRQAYFKDLFTLMCALTGTSTPPANHRAIAQWCANAVEFRDADSVMTPFEYDTNPRDGWSVDGDLTTNEGAAREVVFGAERPEIVITEALAWELNSGTSGLFVALHRPWQSTAMSQTGTTSAEPCDPLLAVSGTSDNIALGKKDAGNAYPLWRLRVVRGGTASCVRFDTNASGPGAPGFVTEFGAQVSGSIPPVMPPNSTLIVYGTNTYQTPTTTGTIPLFSGSSAALATTGSAPLRLPGSGSTATIYLERLSDPAYDPAHPVAAAVWQANTTVSGSTMASGSSTTVSPQMYRIVDSVTVDVENTNTPPPQKYRRNTSGPTSFWRSQFTKESFGTFGNPANVVHSDTDWYHWPNRPFASPMEMLLVRNGDAATMLSNYYTFSSGSNSLRTLTPSAILLDAVQCRTRFAGINKSFWNWAGSPEEAATGIFASVQPAQQISSFREPGRINLNTITGYYDPQTNYTTVTSDVWNALVAGPLPSPPLQYKDQTIVGAPRTQRTARAIPAQPKLGLPAVPATPGGGKKKQTGGTNVSGTSNPQGSLTDAILTIAGTDTYVHVVQTASTTTSSTNTLMVDARNRNPVHSIYTAMRLANAATIRSNVFGVWITLREAVPGDPQSVKLHRAFYIVDRSIPVGFEEGKDHNVRDTIRLRRIIE